MEEPIVSNSVICGSMTLNIISATAFINGQDLRLTPKEFAILLLLTLNEGKMLSAEFIYEKVWGALMAGNKSHNTLFATISTLRKKIEHFGYGIRVSRFKGYALIKI